MTTSFSISVALKIHSWVKSGYGWYFCCGCFFNYRGCYGDVDVGLSADCGQSTADCTKKASLQAEGTAESVISAQSYRERNWVWNAEFTDTAGVTVGVAVSVAISFSVTVSKWFSYVQTAEKVPQTAQRRIHFKLRFHQQSPWSPRKVTEKETDKERRSSRTLLCSYCCSDRYEWCYWCGGRRGVGDGCCYGYCFGDFTVVVTGFGS